MFNITGSAYQKLKEAVDREQGDKEKLLVRLSMGIG
ncbi:hypothetical protein EV146_10474 [Mesobacillus foraminis]|jgi:hypothetical protein|uniref:Uncharacterized protein n=1 Tax=Mesobacillus foraminis TaxID=279826 RepID=A0A4R2BG11_9BACI|nr:hypothetical protein EV146_10474 [Mesobacillus foraminis]